MMQRRVLATMILVGLVVGPFCGCGQSSSSGALATTPSPSGPGKAGTTAGVVSAKAAVVPYKKADLSFKAVGRVQEVLVSEGQVVTAGQELARLETRDLEQAVRRAEAELKAAQAQLAKAQAGARPEEVALAEAAVAIAKGNLAFPRGKIPSMLTKILTRAGSKSFPLRSSMNPKIFSERKGNRLYTLGLTKAS